MMTGNHSPFQFTTHLNQRDSPKDGQRREIKKANELRIDPWGITFYYCHQQSFKVCRWFPSTLTAAPGHPSGESRELNHV